MRRALLLASFLRVLSAILVANGSPCETDCGNVLTSTAPDQIVCDDGEYTSKTEGKVLQSCVSCEAMSPYTTNQGTGPTSDLQAMLFNLRFTTAQCLFRLRTSVCSTSKACGLIQGALEYGNLSSAVTPYGYCSLWSNFDLDKCTDCLSYSGQNVLRNFVSILSGACDLKVKIQPPHTIPLTGDPFSNALVNVTNPTDIPATHHSDSVGPLSYGALAGVVIGGVVVILILAGCGVVLNGKRRRREYLRRRDQQMKNWPSPQGMGGEMFETPTSQVPLRGGGWSDSPISAATDGVYPAYPRYFSPYNSQYNSPVTGVDGQGHVAWPVEKAQSIGVAISPDHDGPDMQWNDRKGKERADLSGTDSYEMQEGINSAGGAGGSVPPAASIYPQAPVLGHPGYGRNGRNPQRPSSWSDRDEA